MLLIPGGTLLKDGKTIYIKPFFMAQTPITQAQWWAIASREDLKIKNNLGLTPSRFKDDYGETSHWLRPVENVSWFDAIEYCGRLAKLTKFPYALPSEAQWEYACHANTEAPLVKLSISQIFLNKKRRNLKKGETIDRYSFERRN